jgi:hypothetical protein
MCVCVPYTQPLVAAGTGQEEEGLTSNDTHINCLFSCIVHVRVCAVARVLMHSFKASRRIHDTCA